MEVLYPRCASLDVHKDSVVAAVRIAGPGGAEIGVRRFDTTTPGLLALGEWLAGCGCTHAVMEATGVYWKPVWHMLRDGTFWRDLGPDHFHRRSPEQQAHHLAQQIAKLGFTCSLAPAADPVSV